ncbi:MAG TPA: phosphate ABC transporter substrate-binding protein PstS [Actinomycetes bacterium]|nr:phosphate ABC transporter substrate-binding protein PstS [Actinomycetes bacterium]
MKRSTLSRAAVPAALVLSLGLTACGAANESTTTTGSSSEPGLSGTLAGAGASSQAAAMEAWVAGFNADNPDVTVNYDPIGSGGGREQFVEGGTDFGGSDAYLDEEELPAAQERCGGDVVEVPLYVSPIAVAFNLEGVDELNLGPAEIAGIFAQKITKWNDPAIAKINPDVDLPGTKITPVNRSDESGTTENFAEYLAATAPDVWTYEVSGVWPVKGGEAAQGTSGVVGAIEGGNGTIGYADASQVGDLSVAKVGVGEEFVSYSPEAAAAVLEVSERVEGRGESSFAYDLARDTTEAGTYPIVLVSYALACSTYESQEKADLVKAFISYLASEEGQQAAAESAGSAPISASLRDQITPAIEGISAG